MEKTMSPTVLWEGFDPEAEQLETNILREDENDGMVTTSLYFTGRTFGKRKSRVYAQICRKGTSSTKPAVIVVGDYHKRIDVEELHFWAKNGFVAMQIDFAGEGEGMHTIYPDDVSYANNCNSPSDFDITDTARETKQYEYALCGMRAITCLTNFCKVKSISVVTIGEGSQIGLMMMGIDKRVTNGAVVLGNLFKEYPTGDIDVEDALAITNAKELSRRGEVREKQQIWNAGLSPQSYVPLIEAPLYVVCGANSGTVNVLKLSEIYLRTNDDSRLLVLPSVIDYVSDAYAQCVVRWCKGGGTRDEMNLTAFVDEEGRHAFRLEADTTSSKLALWYCRDASKAGKNWVRAKLTKKDGAFVGYPELYQQESTVAAFAVMEGEIAFSTEICIAKADCGNPLQPVNVIYTSDSDIPFVPLNFSDSWHGDKNTIERAAGYLDIVGAKGTSMATFATDDKRTRYNNPLTVSFDVCCDVRQQLTLYLIQNFGENKVVYSATATVMGDGKWQRVTVGSEQFRRMGDGRAFVVGTPVDVIGFRAEFPYIVNNMFLV